MKIPEPQAQEAARRPDSGKVPPEQYFRFSLRYWRQIKDFGVGHKDSAWFVSLLERLRQLCDTKLEDVQHSFETKNAMRNHNIDWSAKGIKTKKSDLDWVPTQYLDNSEDYPIQQIQVSKGTGRIVGFYDETNAFNIVLLDPNHNLQPSSYSAYRIRPTRPGDCETSKLRASYERAITSAKGLTGELRRELLDSLNRDQIGDQLVITMRFTREQANSLDECLAEAKVDDAGSFFLECVEDYVTK